MKNLDSDPISGRTSIRTPDPLRGFSALEMIGVLAVISILASVLVPPMVRQMDKTAGDQESAALKSFGDALQQSIMRQRYIPGPANWDWATNIAAELGADVASVTNSPRKQPRFFLIDPNLSIGGSGLPYRQTNNGATSVTKARVMLVSSIGRPLPGSVVSGVASSNDFNAFWNWNDASNALPATTFTWTGWPNSEDLRVQRVDLSPLFVHLVLSSSASRTPAVYSIDQTDSRVTVTNSYFANNSVSFIQNSVLTLYDQFSAIDSQQILIQNSAFLYYLDSWRGSVSGAAFVGGVDIAAVVDQYMSAYPNVRAQNGTNQQAIVVQAMITYMEAYSAWAAANFVLDTSGKKPTAPPSLVNAQLALVAAVQGQYMKTGNNPFEANCQ
jgi:type II secretory pathway pseudopilin PulG